MQTCGQILKRRNFTCKCEAKLIFQAYLTHIHIEHKRLSNKVIIWKSWLIHATNSQLTRKLRMNENQNFYFNFNIHYLCELIKCICTGEWYKLSVKRTNEQ